jgi:hypothetical protein
MAPGWKTPGLTVNAVLQRMFFVSVITSTPDRPLAAMTRALAATAPCGSCAWRRTHSRNTSWFRSLGNRNVHREAKRGPPQRPNAIFLLAILRSPETCLQTRQDRRSFCINKQSSTATGTLYRPQAATKALPHPVKVLGPIPRQLQEP